MNVKFTDSKWLINMKTETIVNLVGLACGGILVLLGIFLMIIFTLELIPKPMKYL